MYDYSEDKFIENILNFALNKGLFDETKKLLIDNNIIVESGNNHFSLKNDISLSEVGKLEILLDTEIIKILTEKEAKILNRRRKIKKLNES